MLPSGVFLKTRPRFAERMTPPELENLSNRFTKSHRSEFRLSDSAEPATGFRTPPICQVKIFRCRVYHLYHHLFTPTFRLQIFVPYSATLYSRCVEMRGFRFHPGIEFAQY
jgi:hypothetical protein